jgi:four helix bundle protein
VVSEKRRREVVRSYRDLDVWRKSIDLTKDLYSATREFPEDKRFGLVFQIRMAGVSLCSNIAEGHTRRTTRDFIQFLYIAKGSAAEIDTQ